MNRLPWNQPDLEDFVVGELYVDTHTESVVEFVGVTWVEAGNGVAS